MLSGTLDPTHLNCVIKLMYCGRLFELNAKKVCK